MLDFTPKDLTLLAQKILELQPDPVPRFRVLRDVLQLDSTCSDYREAEESLQHSKWVKLLQQSQWPDSTWGRFHTQDTTVKQPFPTTEAAISAALDCGLDSHSPMLQQVQKVLLAYMAGEICWPDRPEKHDNPQAWYKVSVPYISAAVLAQIERCHPRLDDFWQPWAEALKISFQSGSYDRQKEIEALNLLLKCRMKRPAPFHIKYPLLILSATHHQLPGDLERQLLNFVMNSPSGIYYVYDKNLRELPPILSKDFWGWFQAHQLLSRFRLWQVLAEEALNWIWAQRTQEGLWDVGDKIYRRPFSCFPLSETWRRPENRKIDSSVVILGLLSRSFTQCSQAALSEIKT